PPATPPRTPPPPGARQQLAPRGQSAPRPGRCADQAVRPFSTDTLVQSCQVIDPGQQQVTAGGLILGSQATAQLLLELAPVGQPGKWIPIRLITQSLAARRLFGEQGLELFHHLIHRRHYPAELRCPGQLGQTEKLPPGNRIGLLDHIVQRSQLSLEQQPTQHDAQDSDQRQPQQYSQCRLPEFTQREQGVTDHLNPRRLTPAVTENGVPSGRFQINQTGKPVRGGAGYRRATALDQHGTGLWLYQANALKVATVKDRADHQLQHRLIPGVRPQR